MKKTNWRLAAAVIVLVFSPLGRQATAQTPPVEPQAANEAVAPDDGWYYTTPAAPDEVKSIVQQKAEIRAEQRMSRLAASRWYGISNSRPTASGMPFTTMYSHAWQQPGGRPFAWHTSSRPLIIFRTASPIYR